ncbi:hypothetical protein BHM03_00039322 [Ensete ventricosum]|nr:hypothetical protein BHM03_00039322 [Ensete ventricosum]
MICFLIQERFDRADNGLAQSIDAHISLTATSTSESNGGPRQRHSHVGIQGGIDRTPRQLSYRRAPLMLHGAPYPRAMPLHRLTHHMTRPHSR